MRDIQLAFMEAHETATVYTANVLLSIMCAAMLGGPTKESKAE
jgi:hypothetical protein